MIENILIILVVGYVLFELLEHVFFPLVWSFANRNRKSLCGNEAMPGKMVEVRTWQGGEGRVFVEGELWKAVSNDHLKPGDRAVVQRVEGMALMVTLSDLSAKPEILNTRPVPVDTREE